MEIVFVGERQITIPSKTKTRQASPWLDNIRHYPGEAYVGPRVITAYICLTPTGCVCGHCVRRGEANDYSIKNKDTVGLALVGRD